MTFEEADRQYQYLASQYQAGQIDRPAFQRACDSLQVQAADGILWRIRPQDGVWVRWDGSYWVVGIPPHKTQTPPAVPPAAAGPPQQAVPTQGVGPTQAVGTTPVAAPAVAAPGGKSGRRWWLTCSLILLLLACCLVVAGGGGYLAVRAGSMSALQLSSQLAGVANVSLVNLDDHVLSAELTQLDVPQDEAGYDSTRLSPFDIGGFSGLQPGRYQIAFASDGNPALTLLCTIMAKNGDSYRFVAVPEGMAVTRQDYEANSADELDARSSSLCSQ